MLDLNFVKNASLFIQKHYKKGDFYLLKLPFNRIFVVTDPEILHHVLIAKEEKYEKSKIYWHQLKAIVGNALGTLEGDDWVWLKRLQMPYFTKTVVANYLPDVLHFCRNYYQRWEKNGSEIFIIEDVIHHFSEMNMAIILKVVFDIDSHTNCAEVAKYIADGEATIAWRSKYPWRPYTVWLTGQNRRASKYLTFFDDFTKKEIEKNNQNPNRQNSLFARLIAQMTIENDKQLSLQDIRNELIIHLGASTETAAVAEGWILYLLTQHPDYLQKIRTEIEQVTQGKTIDESHVLDLKMTTFVIKEALRLYPPSHAIIRDCVVENDEINGIKIKNGDTMFISAYGLHRNPRIWHEPDTFLPERFEQEENFVKYAFIPFGAGRHTCIGRYLGLPQMVLSIAEFCRRYDFQMIDNQKITPLSLSTLKPNVALKMKCKKIKFIS
jgi:cytochrome P450